MKSFLFLFIFTLVNLQNVSNDCYDVANAPTNYNDCIGKNSSIEGQQCCFLKEKDESKNAICVSIKDEDTFRNESFNETIYNIKGGKYYQGAINSLENIDEVICQNISYHNRSECEHTGNVKSIKSCKDKKAELPDEVCCYLKGREERDAFDETECVDIKASDLNDLDTAKEKIKEGTYWSSYSYKYKEGFELVCSSKWLSNIISSILICLLLSLY